MRRIVNNTPPFSFDNIHDFAIILWVFFSGAEVRWCLRALQNPTVRRCAVKKLLILLLMLSSFSGSVEGSLVLEKIINHNLQSDQSLFPELEVRNVNGLAYNPELRYFYVSQGHGRFGYIHTLDWEGNLLNSINVASLFPDNDLEKIASSLCYFDKNLFFLLHVATGTIERSIRTWRTYIVEMSPNGESMFNVIDVAENDRTTVGRGLLVDDRGIWLSPYPLKNKYVMHLSLDGEVLEEFPVPSLLTNSSPRDITVAFDDGFYLWDLGGLNRLIKINDSGEYIGEVELKGLHPKWYGGEGIVTDPASGWLFVQDDDHIFAVSGVPESLYYVPEPITVVLMGFGWAFLRKVDFPKKRKP